MYRPNNIGGFGGANTRTRERIDFARIAQAAAGNAESLCRMLLPDGKRRGREWISRNPTRHDRKPGSFGINLHTGRWADFSTDDRGGDIISLAAYLKGCTQLEAARMIAAELGMAGTAREFATTPTKRTPKTPKTLKAKQRPRGAIGMPGSLKHPQHGEPAAAWMYTDSRSRPLGYACRFEKPSGKIVLPYSWNGEQWEWKAMETPRPLYRLPELMARAGTVVIVTEGEKACAHAAMLLPEAVVTTWAGGCKAWQKTDWEPLTGRRVILWPDADKAGISAMKEIRTELFRVGAASVFTPTLPEGLPQGFDAADCKDRFHALAILAGKHPTTTTT